MKRHRKGNSNRYWILGMIFVLCCGVAYVLGINAIDDANRSISDRDIDVIKMLHDGVNLSRNESNITKIKSADNDKRVENYDHDHILIMNSVRECISYEQYDIHGIKKIKIYISEDGGIYDVEILNRIYDNRDEDFKSFLLSCNSIKNLNKSRYDAWKNIVMDLHE